MGYLDNDSATKETYGEDGFLHTGDLGSIDEKGLVTIHDRIKELIKVNTEGFIRQCLLPFPLQSFPGIKRSNITPQ